MENERRRQDHDQQRGRSGANFGRDDGRQFSDDRFGNERYDEQQRDTRRGGSDAGYGARRGYEDERYRNDERSRFSPDWSRDDAQARYSDEPYYARNREYSDRQSGRGAGGWRGDQNRRTTAEQRDRGLTPRGLRESQYGSDREFGSRYPYGGRDAERYRDEDEGQHYRGYYSRQYRPFSYPGGSGHLFTESWTLTGPHTGRGPKGWKRSDQQIIEEASQRLERDGDVDASDIEVLAENCVITLRGTVEDRAMKRRAEEIVESVYGVRDVMNELRVRPQSSGQTATQGSQAASQRSGQRSRGAQASPTTSSASAAGRSSAGSASSQSQETSAGDDRAQKH
ncbi:MAG TPA: BON domain-containing protein [Gammaproteobacteria bacterium]|nr:BON domain-containing protein [Gammaproteobacteria bacterium]